MQTTALELGVQNVVIWSQNGSKFVELVTPPLKNFKLDRVLGHHVLAKQMLRRTLRDFRLSVRGRKETDWMAMKCYFVLDLVDLLIKITEHKTSYLRVLSA